MSALRRAGTVLRSVYRLLFEPQPLADLRGQAAHEMILRPRSRFAKRNTNPDLEAPADTNGHNVYELTDADSDGSLSDTQELSVPENQAGVRVYGLTGSQWPRPPTCAVTGTATTGAESSTHIGRVQRPGIAEIDAESGAVSGGDSIPGRVHGLAAIVGGTSCQPSSAQGQLSREILHCALRVGH